MALKSRQTVVMIITRTPIEYITMTETSLCCEMTVIGEPSCGGKPSIENENYYLKVTVAVAL